MVGWGRKNKFGAVRVGNFPSKLEAAVWQTLRIIENVQLDRDEQFVYSFRLFANVRAAYGVYTEKGKWVIKDTKLFDKIDGAKREKLRPFWGKPL